MQELSFEEMQEVNGGVMKAFSVFKMAFEIGTGISWVLSKSYGGRDEFPSVPRAGHE